MDQILVAKAKIQVQKPAAEVFDAITDPDKMSQYFISKGSGRLDAGKTVEWTFPEFPDSFPVRVGNIEQDKYISFHWDNGTREMLVEMTLTEASNNSTIIAITEKDAPIDDVGLKWVISNTEGWTNFLACLKAWMEYGIHLRKGAFDFLSAKG
ncbi:SRPBCC domain-containing protein [Filimonas effusa]|uniref:ATPase n=1 Tax=Filimonas effusa TaxID=2508721 RepID=A0A4Q1CZB0_9BACT|nr:SRPBCC domain-containing protein [Filimonas effusa]RXK80737.1 ATPase [Filimonas effusa]